METYSICPHCKKNNWFDITPNVEGINCCHCSMAYRLDEDTESDSDDCAEWQDGRKYNKQGKNQ